MKLAIAIHEGRVSPVLDVAERLLVITFAGRAETARCEEAMPAADLAARAKRIRELGIDTLICGALSRPLEMLLSTAGVRLLARTCGPIDEILRAFREGRLADAAFTMPGCCGRGRGGGRRGPVRGRCRRSVGNTPPPVSQPPADERLPRLPALE